jgi:hypothetical protein
MAGSLQVFNGGLGLKGMEVERGKSENFSALSAEVNQNLACDGYIESTCCCVQAIFLSMETKILFSLLWYIFSAIF